MANKLCNSHPRRSVCWAAKGALISLAVAINVILYLYVYNLTASWWPVVIVLAVRWILGTVYQSIRWVHGREQEDKMRGYSSKPWY